MTITIVAVNRGWNTGFSPVTDLNKGCSLLMMLKLNVLQGVFSFARLDTNIFIGTSWVEIIEGETRVENLRCGAAVVTKIGKNT